MAAVPPEARSALAGRPPGGRPGAVAAQGGAVFWQRREPAGRPPAQGGQCCGQPVPGQRRKRLEAGYGLVVEPGVVVEQVIPAARDDLAERSHDGGRGQAVGIREPPGVGDDGFPAEGPQGNRQGAGGQLPQPHELALRLAAAGRRGAGTWYCSWAAVSRMTASRCLPGDLLGAVADRVVGGLVDQLVQAADHAAGPLVQVGRHLDQGAGLVVVQPQRLLHGRDQLGPVGALGGGGVPERGGPHADEPPGDLPAAHAGEHAVFLQVKPGINKGGADGIIIFS